MEEVKSFLSGCLKSEIPIKHASGDEKTAEPKDHRRGQPLKIVRYLTKD